MWKRTEKWEIWAYFLVYGIENLAFCWVLRTMRRAELRRKQGIESELQAEKGEMQTLLQGIPDGVLIITEDGKINAYSQTLIRILQLDAKTESEEQLDCILGRLYYARLYKKTASACEGLLEDVIEHIVKERENTSIDFGSVGYLGHYLEWRGTTCQWNHSRACILVVREVGQWVQLEALAKKESEAKSALIRSVSHELRTPINAIINISERLMESPSLSDDQKEQCQILVSSSHFLLSNVNDLLDFSKIATEQFILEKQFSKLEETFKTCVELIAPQCHLKGLHLSLRYDSLIPSLVYTDPNRLKQVLLNLLSNAVKFTLKGKIEVIAMLIDPNTVEIAVEDSGIGIAEENQRRIFTLFGKLTANEKLNPQGCGLGLAISNTLVINMGGTGISVKSVPGHGSTFSFTLPISSKPSSLIEPDIADTFLSTSTDEETSEVVLPPSSELWKVPKALPNTLIADDSEFNRLVLRTLMESLGFRCDEARTGTEALRKIERRQWERKPYLFVFLDIEMPEMSGIEVALELRRQVAEGSLAKAQVVGCSAYVSAEDQQSCIDAGMDFFIEKPVSKQRLTALCNRIRA